MVALDPASARTVSRLCATLTCIGAWCLPVRLITGLPVTPVPLLRIAATVAAVFALCRAEQLTGPSLSRWDETAAYLLLAGAIGLAM